MGVPLIWDAIAPGFFPRLSLEELAQRWLEDNGRSLRIAIDGYQWLFESRAGISLQLERTMKKSELAAKTVQLFHARTRLLISLNVSFVYVFDGKFKPKFKRKFGSTSEEEYLENEDFEKYIDNIKRVLDSGHYDSRDCYEIQAVKEMLRHWRINYVEAPADGEAECARLQREGVVDYVLSNDTDTLALGATRVLRNFSKFVEDFPGSAVSSQSPTTKHYMVTPVHMSQVEQETGFDADRLTFLSILMGADYNKGATKFGIVRASQIALCGDAHMEEHVATFDYTELEDFSEELKRLYTTGLSPTRRRRGYEELQTRVLELLKEYPRELFGRKEKALTKDGVTGWAPDFAVCVYYHPLLCPIRFEWEQTTNNAECRVVFVLDSLSLYQFQEQFPMGNVSDRGVFYFKEMTTSYALKYIISEMSDKWEDKDFVKFERVREGKVNEFEDKMEDMLSIRLFGFPHFNHRDAGMYIDPESEIATKGWLHAINLRHLPQALVADLRARQEEKNKLKSPSKRSPSKKSPAKKKKLPPSKKGYQQEQLSPEKLSPRKNKGRELRPPTLSSTSIEPPRTLSPPRRSKSSPKKMFMPRLDGPSLTKPPPLLHRGYSSDRKRSLSIGSSSETDSDLGAISPSKLENFPQKAIDASKNVLNSPVKSVRRSSRQNSKNGEETTKRTRRTGNETPKVLRSPRVTRSSKKLMDDEEDGLVPTQPDSPISKFKVYDLDPVLKSYIQASPMKSTHSSEDSSIILLPSATELYTKTETKTSPRMKKPFFRPTDDTPPVNRRLSFPKLEPTKLPLTREKIKGEIHDVLLLTSDDDDMDDAIEELNDSLDEIFLSQDLPPRTPKKGQKEVIEIPSRTVSPGTRTLVGSPAKQVIEDLDFSEEFSDTSF